MSSEHKGWTAVDLDGTLAYYDGWKGIHHIGEPIPAMMSRVRHWLDEGKEVRIFTARVNNCLSAVKPIQDWLEKHGLPRLAVTCEKNLSMVELWDDRCRQVVPNEGISVESQLAEANRDYLAAEEKAARLETELEIAQGTIQGLRNEIDRLKFKV